LHLATRLTVTRCAATGRYQVARASFTSPPAAAVTDMHAPRALPKMAWRRCPSRSPKEREMFDQPPSLTMRAAIASLLGSCFAIAMIVFTHGAQAQAAATVADPSAGTAQRGIIMRLGDAALAAMRRPDITLAAGQPGARGLRLYEGSSEPSVGLRLQALPRRTLGAEGASARNGSEPLTLGVQVRF
jgi:hypothetical protein